jgi:hypothetical protein
MHADMQRLAGIADIMTPDAEIAHGEGFAAAAVRIEPGAVGGRGGGAGAH